jgi:hypothetical protein
MSVTLDDLLALRDATEAQVRARLGDADVGTDVGYGHLTGLTRISGGDGPSFYFRDGRLVVARLSEPGDEASALVPGDAPRLRSSAGKRAIARVDAAAGVAVTEEDGDVRYVEVFPPTTFEAYRDELHRPPPHFVE